MGAPGRAVRLALVVAALAAPVGCGDDGRGPPAELIDGSPSAIASMPFEGVDGPVVETWARARPAVSPSCGDGSSPGATGVERVGTLGASVTVLSPAPPTARACDATVGSRWCGYAFTHLSPARQLDARLSLTCLDAAESPVGFAWVQPSPDAAYVVVAHDGFAEAYPVLGAAPVRVSTENVDPTTSMARFELSEHDAVGRRLRAYVVQPRVAG